MTSSRACFPHAVASATVALLALAAPDAAAQAGPGQNMFTIAAPADPPAEPAEPPPPPGPAHRWELTGALSGSAYNFNSNGISYASGNQITGALGVTHFLKPVVDDGAPRSLEPYLQRTSTLSFSASAGAWGTSQTNPTNFNSGDKYGGVGAGFNVYATSVLAFTGSFTYGYDVAHADMTPDQASHSFTGTGGIGLRFGDTRIDGIYAFSARDTEGTFSPLRWGTATLSVTTVIGRSFYMYGFGQALESGGGGGLSLEGHPNRDLGLYAGGYGKRGELFDNDEVIANKFGADVGVAYWIAPSVQIQAEYDFTYTERDAQTIGALDYYAYTQLTHGVTLSVAVRLR